MKADTLARIIADKAYDVVYLKVVTKLEDVKIKINDTINITQVFEVGGSFIFTEDGFQPVTQLEN